MMSQGWSWYVIVLVVANILGILWLLIATSRKGGADHTSSHGHKWDGIEELNYPMPRWWFGLFIITIIFSGVYLYLYPGLGTYQGSLGWSQTGQFEQSLRVNRAKQDAYFAEFLDLDIVALAGNKKAMGTAERLFLNNCAACHGSGAKGAIAYPNLADSDWLYGGSPTTIQQSITNGRAGVMPNLAIKPEDAAILAYYVQGLAGMPVSAHVEQRGKSLFGVCAACHGAEGKGNQALGAPNLTDDIWLHGSSLADIEAILRNGKQGNMPSFKALLSENEIKLLSAYVYSISGR